MISRRPAAALLTLALVVSVTACGGSDDGDDTSTPTSSAGATTTTAGGDDSTSLPTLPETKADFEDADAKVRFVNAFSDAGEGKELAMKWGTYSGTEDAATLGYGEVSDLLDARVPTNTYTEEEEGKVSLSLLAGLTDAAKDAQPLMTDDETVAEGQELIWIIGTDQDYNDPTHSTATARFIFTDGGDSDVPEPPAGKAYLFLVEAGVGHLENDFVTLGSPGACLTFTNDSGGGNAGNAYEVAPGSIELGIYDSNGGCTEATGETVTLDAKAGHRYVVVALGPTKETRTPLVIDLDE